jgi:hypothetical protein
MNSACGDVDGRKAAPRIFGSWRHHSAVWRPLLTAEKDDFNTIAGGTICAHSVCQKRSNYYEPIERKGFSSSSIFLTHQVLTRLIPKNYQKNFIRIEKIF